ncbi:MAG: 4Fe-4S binding protein [Candidatus Omnitrophica bacterium]|nr:4Fe-4S binding protein [Candidatus Omnitrophota bacterium]
MMKKLFIDYDICSKCEKCLVRCSYIFHPDNNGIISLRELVGFLFVCRRCDDYPCVNACPNNALERKDGVIKRSNFLCISCKSCAMACPFGTIEFEWLEYLTSICDVCTGARIAEKERFSCINSCPYGALKIIEQDDIKEDVFIHKINENIVVKAFSWTQFYELKK